METPEDQRDARAQARVVSRHLPSGYTAEPDVSALESNGGALASSAASGVSQQTAKESSLNLQGGDMHRDLFKVEAKARMPRRAATFAYPSKTTRPTEDDFSVAEQQAPGGFRRQFVAKKLKQRRIATAPVTRNFVAFLDLYGSFAGEDLGFDDDDSEVESVDVEEAVETSPSRGERRPLLGRRQTSKRAARTGDATLTASFFTLLKAFIGTGILFLPKAFKNGGLIFSLVTLIFVAALSCLCFHLLLQCRQQYGGGYGELGGSIGGPKLRTLILASITISQIGFVCASLIFTAENVFAVLQAVIHGNNPISTTILIAIGMVWLIPFSLIRNISKLGPVALIADVCIAIGLAYIYWYDISTLANKGMHETVQNFNPDHWTLTVGSAIFTFEGIGLILPIQSSMKEPQKFGLLLYIVMVIITIVFSSVGFLSYATFGDRTQTEIMSNFPQTSKMVNAVQSIYSFAVLVGTPVQLFPAIRILEGKLFGRFSGKRDMATKWKKNAFRTGIVLVCGVISILGASDLDKFVALIGSFACVPLVYIYPAFLHYKGVATNWPSKSMDILIMALGLAGMVFTTAITVIRWIQE